MTPLLFFTLGNKVVAVCDDIVGVGLLAQFFAQLIGAGDGACFQQVGQSGYIAPRCSFAFFNTANAVANVEFEIPKQSDKGAKIFLPARLNTVAGQNQQVNIRVRMKFAAAVTANGNERNIG